MIGSAALFLVAMSGAAQMRTIEALPSTLTLQGEAAAPSVWSMDVGLRVRSFGLDVRYQPPFAGSGPLFPTRGEVTLGTTTTIVDDYFRLVYAGEHHNWNNQFWVLFDAPLTYQGHAVHGVWLDEAAFNSELDGVYTLDAARRPLDTLTATSYVVERAP